MKRINNMRVNSHTLTKNRTEPENECTALLDGKLTHIHTRDGNTPCPAEFASTGSRRGGRRRGEAARK